VRRAARRLGLSEQDPELPRDRLGLGRELAPRDADDAPAVDDQGAVSGAVVLEGLAGAVGGEAIALDDEPLLRPPGIELAVSVTRLISGPWQVVGIEEVQEAGARRHFG
jgi:hypothetical protein